jgi:hypothetical protein
MHAGPDVETEFLDPLAGEERAADGIRRAVEHREETVTGRVDLVSAGGLQLGADQASLGGQQPAPPDVPHLACELGRADHIREHHGT